MCGAILSGAAAYPANFAGYSSSCYSQSLLYMRIVLVYPADFSG